STLPVILPAMTDKITCPNCGHTFDVEEAISGQLEARIKADYEKKIARQAEIFQAEKKKIEAERQQLEEARMRQGEQVRAELAKALVEERKKIESTTREQFGEQMRALTEENEKRKAENK